MTAEITVVIARRVAGFVQFATYNIDGRTVFTDEGILIRCRACYEFVGHGLIFRDYGCTCESTRIRFGLRCIRHTFRWISRSGLPFGGVFAGMDSALD